MRVLDLFAGIGGFSLAAHWEGLNTAMFCEIDPRSQNILKKNFPGIPIHDDIRTLKDIPEVDIISATFPCTGTSQAGRREGLKNQQSSLWLESLRIIENAHPKFIFIENPTGFLYRGIEDVCKALSKIGYVCEWITVSGRDIGAPTRRERVLLIAYSYEQWEQYQPTSWDNQVRTVIKKIRDSSSFPVIERRSDGAYAWFSSKLDAPGIEKRSQPHRLNARILIGKTIIPQYAQVAIQRIKYLNSLFNSSILAIASIDTKYKEEDMRFKGYEELKNRKNQIAKDIEALFDEQSQIDKRIDVFAALSDRTAAYSATGRLLLKELEDFQVSREDLEGFMYEVASVFSLDEKRAERILNGFWIPLGDESNWVSICEMCSYSWDEFQGVLQWDENILEAAAVYKGCHLSDSFAFNWLPKSVQTEIDDYYLKNESRLKDIVEKRSEQHENEIDVIQEKNEEIKALKDEIQRLRSLEVNKLPVLEESLLKTWNDVEDFVDRDRKELDALADRHPHSVDIAVSHVETTQSWDDLSWVSDRFRNIVASNIKMADIISDDEDLPTKIDLADSIILENFSSLGSSYKKASWGDFTRWCNRDSEVLEMLASRQKAKSRKRNGKVIFLENLHKLAAEAVFQANAPTLVEWCSEEFKKKVAQSLEEEAKADEPKALEEIEREYNHPNQSPEMQEIYEFFDSIESQEDINNLNWNAIAWVTGENLIRLEKLHELIENSQQIQRIIDLKQLYEKHVEEFGNEEVLWVKDFFTPTATSLFNQGDVVVYGDKTYTVFSDSGNKLTCQNVEGDGLVVLEKTQCDRVLVEEAA